MFCYGNEGDEAGGGGGGVEFEGEEEGGVSNQRYFELCFILGFHCVLSHFVVIFRSISLNRSRIANEWRVNTMRG